MKRVLFAILAMAAITFTGCGKDEASSLNGTVWTYGSDKLTFTSNECTSVMENFFGDITIKYTYTYNKPNVRLKPKTSGWAELKGVVSGDIMRLTNVETGDSVGIYTKQ